MASGNAAGFLIDDEDVYVPYRRPKLEQSNDAEDDDLSDYVKLRLLIARELALSKFRERNQAAV